MAITRAASCWYVSAAHIPALRVVSHYTECSMTSGMPNRLALALLALLAIVAYGPLLTIPLFEDDFPNLMQAQQYGAPADALTLLHNPVFRLRATSFWIMFLLWRAAKLTPLVYHLTSLALHILNSWLVYAV